jgi:hypothetical protein
MIRLTKAAIEACFEDATHQADVLVRLYKLVFPDWDQIVSVNNWPECNENTWKHICRLFMTFDQKHHGSLPGGLWLNHGFSGNESLPDWAVSIANCQIVRAQ